MEITLTSLPDLSTFETLKKPRGTNILGVCILKSTSKATTISQHLSAKKRKEPTLECSKLSNPRQNSSRLLAAERSSACLMPYVFLNWSVGTGCQLAGWWPMFTLELWPSTLWCVRFGKTSLSSYLSRTLRSHWTWCFSFLRGSNIFVSRIWFSCDFGGRGCFKKLREACTNNFHLFSTRSEFVVSGYFQTTKNINGKRSNDPFNMSVAKKSPRHG